MRLSTVGIHSFYLRHIDLPLLSDLAREQEEMYEQWMKEYRISIYEHAEGCVDAGDERYLESAAEEISYREEYYPQYIRYSTFLVSFSALEAGIHRLAKAAHIDGHTMKAPPPTSFHLGDAKEYFKSNTGINWAAVDADWSLLNRYRLARNAIAHGRGLLNERHKDNDELCAFLTGRSDVSLEGNNIVLGEEWCGQFVCLARRVVRALVKELGGVWDP